MYPDELEELYGTHAHIKELSIVGLPGRRRRREGRLPLRARLRRAARARRCARELEEHFRQVSAELPFYRRVKVLRSGTGAAETSTRKVKRKLVVEELKRLERVAAPARRPGAGDATGGINDWLLPPRRRGDAASRPARSARRSRLAADLGFDSLMLTELSVALEAGGRAAARGGGPHRACRPWRTCASLLASAGRRPPSRPRACSPRRPRPAPEDRGDPGARRRWPAWAGRCSPSGRRCSTAASST